MRDCQCVVMRPLYRKNLESLLKRQISGSWDSDIIDLFQECQECKFLTKILQDSVTYINMGTLVI